MFPHTDIGREAAECPFQPQRPSLQVAIAEVPVDPGQTQQRELMTRDSAAKSCWYRFTSITVFAATFFGLPLASTFTPLCCRPVATRPV